MSILFMLICRNKLVLDLYVSINHYEFNLSVIRLASSLQVEHVVSFIFYDIIKKKYT